MPIRSIGWDKVHGGQLSKTGRLRGRVQLESRAAAAGRVVRRGALDSCVVRLLGSSPVIKAGIAGPCSAGGADGRQLAGAAAVELASGAPQVYPPTRGIRKHASLLGM
jgi:hypothetical protein